MKFGKQCCTIKMSTDLSNGHLLLIAKFEQLFDPILRFWEAKAKSNWLHRFSFSKQISRDFKSLRASRLGFRTKREHEGSSRHKRHMNQEQVTWLDHQKHLVLRPPCFEKLFNTNESSENLEDCLHVPTAIGQLNGHKCHLFGLKKLASPLQNP